MAFSRKLILQIENIVCDIIEEASFQSNDDKYFFCEALRNVIEPAENHYVHPPYKIKHQAIIEQLKKLLADGYATLSNGSSIKQPIIDKNRYRNSNENNQMLKDIIVEAIKNNIRQIKDEMNDRTKQNKTKDIFYSYQTLAVTYTKLGLYEEALKLYDAILQTSQVKQSTLREKQAVVELLENRQNPQRTRVKIVKEEKNYQVKQVTNTHTNSVTKITVSRDPDNKKEWLGVIFESPDHIKIHGFGKNFKFDCTDYSGQLTLINPNAKVTLTGDLSKLHTITGDLDTLVIDADLHCDHAITIKPIEEGRIGWFYLEKGRSIQTNSYTLEKISISQNQELESRKLYVRKSGNYIEYAVRNPTNTVARHYIDARQFNKNLAEKFKNIIAPGEANEFEPFLRTILATAAEHGHAVLQPILVKTQNAAVYGEINSVDDVTFDTQYRLEFEPTAGVKSKSAINLMAEIIPHMRGKIIAGDKLSVNATVYARGRALFSAGNGLDINGQSFMTYSKTQVQWSGDANVKLAHAFVVENKSNFKGNGPLYLNVSVTKNYSTVEATEIIYRSEKELTHYLGASFIAKIIVFKGSNHFFRGDIKGGVKTDAESGVKTDLPNEKLIIEINGAFTIGVDDARSIIHDLHKRPKFYSDSVSIVTPFYSNLAGHISTGQLNISCLTYLSLLGVETYTSRSLFRPIVLDYGIEIVNIPAILRRIRNFSAASFSWGNLLDNSISFVSWMMKHFIPALNVFVDAGVGTYRTLKALPALFKAYKQFATGNKSNELCEYIKLFSATFNLAMQTNLTASADLLAYQANEHGVGTIEVTGVHDTSDLIEIAVDAGNLTGIRTSSVDGIAFSGGIQIHPYAQQQAFYSQNNNLLGLHVSSSTAASYAVQNGFDINKNVSYVSNHLQLAGTNLADNMYVNTQDLTQSGKETVTNLTTTTTHATYTSTADTQAKTASVRVSDTFNDDGEFKVSESLAINATHVNMKENSNTDAVDLDINAHDLTDAGDTHATQFTATVEHATFTATAHTHATTANVTATDTIDDDGVFDVTDTFTLTAPHVHMNDDSTTNAPTLTIHSQDGGPGGHIMHTKILNADVKKLDIDKLLSDKNINIEEKINVNTETSWQHQQATNNQCEVAVITPSAEIAAPLAAHGLTLITTQGPIHVIAPITSSGHTTLSALKDKVVIENQIRSKFDNQISGYLGVDVLSQVRTKTVRTMIDAELPGWLREHQLHAGNKKTAWLDLAMPKNRPKVEVITTTTEVVQTAGLTSETGSNTILSEAGGTQMLAAELHGAQDTFIKVHDQMTLHDATTTTTVTRHLTHAEHLTPLGKAIYASELKTTQTTATAATNISSGNNTTLASTHNSIINQGGNVSGTNTTALAGKDIENDKVLSATNHLELDALHDVKNNCKVTETKNRFGGTEQTYESARFQSGDGGTHAHAGNKEIFNGGESTSTGNNDNEGDHGVELNALKNTRIVDAQEDEGFFETTTIVIKKTQTHVSAITSNKGEVSVTTKFDKVKGEAPVLAGGAGTHTKGTKGVELSGLTVTEIREETTDIGILGIPLSHKKVQETDEYEQPAIFLVEGDSSASSAEGDVNFSDVLALGHGNLTLSAPEGTVELHNTNSKHQETRETQGFNVCVPLAEAAHDIAQHGVSDQQLATLLPVVGDANHLAHSNGVSAALNAANLAADLLSFTNNPTLLPTPSATLSYSKKTEKTYSGTPGLASVNIKGKLTVEAKKFVDEGVPLTANSAKFAAKTACFSGQKIQGSYDAEEKSISVTGSFQGVSVGATYTKQHAETVNYATLPVKIQNELELAVEEMKVEDTTISARKISAPTKLKKLSIETHASTSTSEATGLALNFNISQPANSNVAYTHATQHTEKALSQSGIHASESIDLAVENTSLKNSSITSDGENHFQTDHLEQENVPEIREENFTSVSTDHLQQVMTLLSSVANKMLTEEDKIPQLQKQTVNHEKVHRWNREANKNNKNKSWIPAEQSEHKTHSPQPAKHGLEQVIIKGAPKGLVKSIAKNIEKNLKKSANSHAANARSILKDRVIGTGIGELYGKERLNAARYFHASKLVTPLVKSLGPITTATAGLEAVNTTLAADDKVKPCVAIESGSRFVATVLGAGATAVAIAVTALPSWGATLLAIPSVPIVGKLTGDVGQKRGEQICELLDLPKPGSRQQGKRI
ncbi:MAG: hypothetical protein ABI597_06850 [Gammaproteobacteria bacterium]